VSVAGVDHQYAVFRRSGGGLGLAMAGVELVLRPSGALWIEAKATLVVADLHLEKGSFFAARGQMLPPYDTRETLIRLAAEVEALAPRVVVLLGDSFHDGEGEGRLCADDVASLHALASGRNLIWLAGNHDAAPPGALPGETAASVALAGLRLVHEPAAGPAAGEIAGHLHPCAKIIAAFGAVRRRCFVTDGERMILPAFGAFAGGLNVRDAAFAALFTRRPMAAALGAAWVHAVGWRSLRGD
jgi:hypothetical protein